ncbi:hypothetical protein, partial [Paenibacillus xylanexedens]|uniref:hypothetical protein n=1 Tax=Paenibacillus xylanexedens TaxID=528191 RepID=UPI0021B34704
DISQFDGIWLFLIGADMEFFECKRSRVVVNGVEEVMGYMDDVGGEGEMGDKLNDNALVLREREVGLDEERL